LEENRVAIKKKLQMSHTDIHSERANRSANERKANEARNATEGINTPTKLPADDTTRSVSPVGSPGANKPKKSLKEEIAALNVDADGDGPSSKPWTVT